jgi:cytochrome c oxidase accessory protein FixG
MKNTAINNKEPQYGHSSYRDALTTVDDNGKRLWVFAKKFKGKWQNRRRWVGYSLLAFLIAAPFIKMNGHGMLQFDFIHRKFVLFGGVFWPADFYLFVIATIAFIIFVFLFTSILGRLWCGWACPQTIFMELIFRRVEYWIEGDAPAQRKLDKMEWNDEKIRKRGGKYLAFFVVSFLISNLFLTYITGAPEWIKMVTESPAKHVGGLITMFGFSAVFFFVYAYMREQVCTIICPYGRLQSVLIDSKTLIVAYDNKRGEPRENHGRNRSESAGDCIDCAQCVTACPTGIDIRNGLQLECTNCTACIDACNHVMLKIGKEPSLVGYHSLDGIEKGEKFKLNTRRKLYICLICVLLTGLILLLSSRSDVQATILHTPGMEYSRKPDGTISNIYNVRVLNKTFMAMPVELRLENMEGHITIIGDTQIMAPAEDINEGIISIEIPQSALHETDNAIKIGVYNKGKRIEVVKTSFMAPQQ